MQIVFSGDGEDRLYQGSNLAPPLHQSNHHWPGCTFYCLMLNCSYGGQGCTKCSSSFSSQLLVYCPRIQWNPSTFGKIGCISVNKHKDESVRQGTWDPRISISPWLSSLKDILGLQILKPAYDAGTSNLWSYTYSCILFVFDVLMVKALPFILCPLIW